MRIVLLCGTAPNQVALACKIAREFDLEGIVFERPKPSEFSDLSVRQLFEKVLDYTVFSCIRKSWLSLMTYYVQRFPIPPQLQQITVENVNSKQGVSFIKQLQPDLIMVSGTSLIKRGILDLKVSRGIINLHTGLSPYVKGGPNCTNWCIANNDLHLIGNTVMWIDAGIDSGDLIATETTLFDSTRDLTEIHVKVMEHGHNLYLRSADAIRRKYPDVNRIRQSDITRGVTFYSKQWTFAPKMRMLLHLRAFDQVIVSDEHLKAKGKIKTVLL